MKFISFSAYATDKTFFFKEFFHFLDDRRRLCLNLPIICNLKRREEKLFIAIMKLLYYETVYCHYYLKLTSNETEFLNQATSIYLHYTLPYIYIVIIQSFRTILRTSLWRQVTLLVPSRYFHLFSQGLRSDAGYFRLKKSYFWMGQLQHQVVILSQAQNDLHYKYTVDVCNKTCTGQT